MRKTWFPDVLIPLTFSTLCSAGIVFVLLFSSCEKKPDSPKKTGSYNATKVDITSSGPAVKLVINYSSEKKTWMTSMIADFLAKNPKTSAGRSITIDAKASGSGESMQEILSGERKPHVFSPASSAYISLLNETWLSQAGHTKDLAPQGEALVLSPIVIAMWKPMAEALGWPEKSVGWQDLIDFDKNPKGWGSVGYPEWGRFKMGHTHPGLSNSGLLAFLAEAYAGAKKQRGLTQSDLEAKSTKEFLSKVESTLVHYGKSTNFFADKMLERGPSYISAAVLYENIVIESYNKTSNAPFPIVAIYPVEGTFWSDHPYSILEADWVGDEEKEAAQLFLEFLQEKPQQEKALALGFRPGDPSVSIGAPIDLAHGVDPKQPQTLLDIPDGPTLSKLIEVWHETKKSADITLVFDKSGSMNGEPLQDAKAGAKDFLANLDNRDQVSILFFDNNVYKASPLRRLDEAGRKALDKRLDGVIASGGTALYDALASAQQDAKKRVAKLPNQIHAIVVMTDGKDEHSKLSLRRLKRKLKTSIEDENSIKIFTIAYGDQADPVILSEIAEVSRGMSAKGNTANIDAIFREMASFF